MRKRRPSRGVSTGALHVARVGGEVVRGDEAAALARELEQRRADRAVVRARCALGRERLERGDEARLLEQLARLEQRAAGRVHARAFAHRHHRLEHAQAGDVRRPASSTPSRASRSAGSTSRGHGSRPCASHSAPSPAGTPGTAHDAGPTA